MSNIKIFIYKFHFDNIERMLHENNDNSCESVELHAAVYYSVCVSCIIHVLVGSQQMQSTCPSTSISLLQHKICQI